MGGSVNSIFQAAGGFGMPQQQFTPQTFSNSQVLDYARGNNTNADSLNAYQDEIKKQLRAGDYKDPYKVWGNVMNNNAKAEFDKQQAQLLMAVNQQTDQAAG